MKRANETEEELKRLKAKLGAASGMLPYAVPDGYFATLASHLAEGAIAAESSDRELSISKKQPFEVPDGYLTALPDLLLDQAKTATPTAGKGRIISLRPQAKKFIRLAVAAMLVAGLGLGSYRFYALHTPDGKAAHQLAKVDSDSLNSYVMQHIDEFDDESLENAVASSQTDIHVAVSSLDESEIEAYLNETGEAVPKHLN